MKCKKEKNRLSYRVKCIIFEIKKNIQKTEKELRIFLQKCAIFPFHIASFTVVLYKSFFGIAILNFLFSAFLLYLNQLPTSLRKKKSAGKVFLVMMQFFFVVKDEWFRF
jgi:hypothetical protein